MNTPTADTATTPSVRILAQGGFERGTDVLRNGEPLCRVPACTYWDDDRFRVIEVNGEALVQYERLEIRGRRAFPTGEWTTLSNLGPVSELVFKDDCPRGCCCDECYPSPVPPYDAATDGDYASFLALHNCD